MTEEIKRLKRQALEMMEGDNYEEAVKILCTIIDEMETHSPLYKYYRAKCYYQMGKDYLQPARKDLHKILNYCTGKDKPESYILKAKTLYLSGILEMEFGQDIRRSAMMFEEYLRMYSTVFVPKDSYYKKNELKRNNPDIISLKEHCQECLEQIKNGEIEVSNFHTEEQLAEQAKEFNALWEEFEITKMDVTPGSKWYLVSAAWLKNFKEYVLQNPGDSNNEAMRVEHPGMITNEDILDNPEHLLRDPTEVYLDYNLKENLLEETHYFIVNQKVWDFLHAHYSGVEVMRYGEKKEGNEECCIEANLIKINIHYFPSQEGEDTQMYQIFESRHKTIAEFKERLARLQGLQKTSVRLWKSPIPSDFDTFYRNNLCEFRKHRHIRLNATYLKKLSETINDVQLSLDDFIIVECKCRGDFIFEEIEKQEGNEVLHDHIEDEELKEALTDAKSLRFLNLDITSLFDSRSNEGKCGLSNLGNTCFMNSALQCMSNTTELTKYFLFGLHKNEINYDNPLGTKGRLATAYAKLMKELWVKGDGRVAPWDVKKAIGTVAYQFQGFAQQDSFELFNYVTDTLHEDLNRVIEKPYTEFKDSDGRPDSEVSADHWKAFTDRNQSVIVDLMYGQLKSRLICDVCKNISNTFDPYLALSLPIPKNKFSRISITYFPEAVSTQNPVQKLKLNVGIKDSVEDLKAKIKALVKTENPILLYTLRRKDLIGERIDDDVLATKLEDERLTAYEYTPIDREEKSKTSCVQVHFVSESRSMFGSSNYTDVCAPKIFLHHVDKTCTDLKLAIFKYLFPLITLPEQYQEAYEKKEDKEKVIRDIYEAFYNKSQHGISKIFTIEYESQKTHYYSSRKFKEFKDSEETFGEFVENLVSIDNVYLRICFPRATKVDLDPLEDSKYSGHSIGESAAISIDDCIEKFSVEELLTDDNRYYCSKCEKHQDTYKKMDIYKLPKILVVQLKRFSKGESSGSKYSGYSAFGRMIMGSSKNSDLIDFPLKGLDMGKYLLDNEGKEYLYDCYAVSNHSGSLGGGHYVAHCKNSLDNKWYYFNDSSCGKSSDREIVCSSAYVLFYRLRE